MRYLIFWIVFSASIASAAVDSVALKKYDAKISQQRQRTDSLRVLIQSSEKKLRELKDEESRQVQQLNEVEILVAASNAYIDTLEGQRLLLKVDLMELREAIDSLGASLQIRQKQMEERLRKMYATGQPDLLSILLGASTPEEISQRVQVMQQLGTYDQKLLKEIKAEQTALNTKEAMLRKSEGVLQKLIANKKVERARLDAKREERKNILKNIQSEKGNWEAAVQELMAAQRELASLVDNLIEQRTKASGAVDPIQKTAFEQMKGALPWPASGVVSSPYGKVVHPVYKTVTVNKGIDIKAALGTPVKPVASGTVEYVGRMRGYGLFVIVNHAGGFLTIYAHLNSTLVHTGQKITPQNILGRVGESGSLTGPKLHFELRNAQGSQNPEEWLAPR